MTADGHLVAGSYGRRMFILVFRSVDTMGKALTPVGAFLFSGPGGNARNCIFANLSMMPNLYMILLGCTPAGRHTEQHDIYFAIAGSLPALLPDLRAFWPGENRLHIDAWREVRSVDGYRVEVVPKTKEADGGPGLFFINLGGYRPDEFEEFHYRMLIVAPDKATAIQSARASAFFRHTGFTGAQAHVDDKYGVDVDEVFEIADILPAGMKERYSLRFTPEEGLPPDSLHLGYLKLSALE